MSKNIIFITLWKDLMCLLFGIMRMYIISMHSTCVSNTLNDTFRCQVYDEIIVVIDEE